MAYARIHDDVVVEICNPVPGFSIQQCFHVDLIDKMVFCGDDVQPGWFYEPATGRFSETGEFPAIEESVVEETPAPEEPTEETPPA